MFIGKRRRIWIPRTINLVFLDGARFPTKVNNDLTSLQNTIRALSRSLKTTSALTIRSLELSKGFCIRFGPHDQWAVFQG